MDSVPEMDTSNADSTSINININTMAVSTTTNNLNNSIAAAAAAASSSSSPSSSTPSRYENQKRRDWNTFGQYLRNHRPPLSLSRCSGAHVLEFLRYLDQFGKTKVHTQMCPSSATQTHLLLVHALSAKPGAASTPSSAAFEPPSKSTAASLRPTLWSSCCQSKGISYEKKKRKRPPQQPPALPPPTTS
ncbi:hypothetical protein AAG906_017004 [Vitis piasezkii]